MVCIDGQRRPVKQHEGLLPLCKKFLGFVAKMHQASYKSNAKTTSPLATVATPRTPTHLAGPLPDTVRPEPVEACPEGTRRACPEGTRRGPRTTGSPHPSHAVGNPTPGAAQHTDTALLPPYRCLRYRLPMEVAISHRNQNVTSPHAVGGANLVVGGMVCIDGQRRPVKQHGGLLPLCKIILGFVAKMRQASYKSNAKTTSPLATVATPRTPIYLVGAIRESDHPVALERPALRLSKGPVLRFSKGLS